jgi:hypothetical protein
MKLIHKKKEAEPESQPPFFDFECYSDLQVSFELDPKAVMSYL